MPRERDAPFGKLVGAVQRLLIVSTPLVCGRKWREHHKPATAGTLYFVERAAQAFEQFSSGCLLASPDG